VISQAAVTAVLYAPVLDLMIGSPAVMAEQCKYVRELAEQRLVSLFVVPEGTPVGLGGSCDIASRKGHAIVSLQTLARDLTTTETATVEAAQVEFDQILGASMPAAESVELVLSKEESWQSQASTSENPATH
jgi:hypothetical protein